jgi:hypothetical protein
MYAAVQVQGVEVPLNLQADPSGAANLTICVAGAAG